MARCHDTSVCQPFPLATFELASVLMTKIASSSSKNRCSGMQDEESELGCKSNMLLWAESGLIAEKKKDRVFR